MAAARPAFAVLGLALALRPLVAADPPPIDARVGHRIEVAIGDAELGLDGRADPYDAAQVRIDALIVAPDGSTGTQPCFWCVPQALASERHFQTELGREVEWERFHAAGPGGWRLRLLPTVPGRYAWTWHVVTPHEDRTVPGGACEATAADERAPFHGLIEVGPEHRGFRHRDGTPFVPVGLNLAWADEGGSATFAGWLDRLRDSGANCSRLWMIHYYGGTSLEWTPTGVNDGYRGTGSFSQESAARLDRMFAAAEQRGIALMLCCFTFGNLNWDWAKNPWCVQAGGWLRDPGELFTDPRALAQARSLLRYTVARWGAEPSLWAWELWNEVDACAGFDGTAALEWHRAMAAALKRDDWHRHLVTTDYRFPPPEQPCLAYALPDIDFVQIHEYLPDLPATFLDYVDRFRPFAKPIVIGEYGLHVLPNYFAIDPRGLHLHDGLWSGAFAGSAGAALGWWWDRYVAPNDLFFHHRGIARFLAGESLDAASRLAASVDDDRLLVMALDGPTPMAWVSARRDLGIDRLAIGWDITAYGCAATSGPARVTFARPFAGAWRAVLWDTFDGVPVGSQRCEAVAGGLAVAVPAFRHDLALKLVPDDGREIAAAPTPVHDRFVVESTPRPRR